MYQIGLLHEQGKGVKADGEEAKNWYRKAADKGHAEAKEALERLGG